MAGSPYVPDAKKYHPGDLERVPGEPPDPDPASWGMQPDGTFLPPALTPSVPRDIFVDWEGQLPEYDQKKYLVNTTEEGFWPYVTNTSHSWQAIYDMDGRRYMLHYGGGNRWNVYDITDPRDLQLVDEETLPWTGPGFGAVTIAWNEKLGKRIAIQASETPRYFLKGRVANKHLDPTVEPQLLEWEGLRGFRVFEVKGPTPRDWDLLATVSTDPNHGPDEIQEGNGVLDLPVYYGGDYLFVGSAPDNTFINQPYKTTLWTAGHIAYDVSDPANPKRLSTWWVNGSRRGEEADSPYLPGTTRPPGSARGWACSCRAPWRAAGSMAMPRRAARASSSSMCPTPRTCARSAGARSPRVSPGQRATTSTRHRWRRPATSTSPATR